jgi:hypothetical protein
MKEIESKNRKQQECVSCKSDIYVIVVIGWLFLDPIVFLFIEKNTCKLLEYKIRMKRRRT